MKNRTLMSLLLSAALLCSNAAFASEALDPNQPECFAGYVSAQEISQQREQALPKLYESSTCFVPYNPGSGATGEIAVEFVAAGTTARFTLESKYDGSYHCQLYRVDEGGAVTIGAAALCAFGSGPSYEQLTVGATYYLMISSLDVAEQGTSGGYTLDVD